MSSAVVFTLVVLAGTCSNILVVPEGSRGLDVTLVGNTTGVTLFQGSEALDVSPTGRYNVTGDVRMCASSQVDVVVAVKPVDDGGSNTYMKVLLAIDPIITLGCFMVFWVLYLCNAQRKNYRE